MPPYRDSSSNSSKCYGWSDAPDVVADYARLLSQLGLDDRLRLWAENYLHDHAGRVLWDIDFLINNYEFSRCANIGGAPFLFEYLMKRARPQVELISVDLDPGRFPRAQSLLGIKVIAADVERAFAETTSLVGQIQCLVFCEIFEHLRIDLLKTISFLRTLLTEDGFMYLTTPNGLGIGALCKHILRGRTGPNPVIEWSKINDLGHMGHVREYSYLELREVLAWCGFEIEQCMFRRKTGHAGTAASRLRDWSVNTLSGWVPALGNEIVVVARKRSK